MTRLPQNALLEIQFGIAHPPPALLHTSKQQLGPQSVHKGTRERLPVSKSSTRKILRTSCCSLIGISFELKRIFSIIDCCQQETDMSVLPQVLRRICKRRHTFLVRLPLLSQKLFPVHRQTAQITCVVPPHGCCTHEPLNASTCRNCSCNASASA